MKKTIFTLLAATVALSASAQFQISYNNAAGQLPGTVVIKNDSISTVNNNGGGLPSFAPANNMLWDLSNVNYTSQVAVCDFDTSTSVVFIPAEYSNKIRFMLTNVIPYITEVKFEIRSTGMFSYGEHIDRQAYSLGLSTGDNMDSLVILTQDILYSGPVVTVPYPAAPGISQWSNNNIVMTTNMELTYNAQGYNQAAMSKVTHTSTLDSAVGYGRITCLRYEDGMQGGEVDVLQVKRIVTVMDSFYVGAAPMPSNVLSTFNLSQGQTNMVYEYAFYRAGEVTPMLTVRYDDPAFTQIHDIQLHRERMPYAASVKNVGNNNSLAIYPNPAANTVNISVKDMSLTTCTYDIMNTVGQVVATGTTPVISGNAVISLTDIPTGMYYIRLSGDNTVIGQSPLSVIK